MKKVITFVVAVAVGALGVAARPGGAAPPASAVARCDGGRPARSDLHGLAVGAGIAGADGAAIWQTGSAGTELVVPPDRGRGVVRHISSRPGVGTAYVRDRKGGDLVVSVTGRGVRRYSTHGEALQPSLSAHGDVVWAEVAGALRISKYTVHIYVKHLYQKYGVSSRGQLLSLFVRMNP